MIDYKIKQSFKDYLNGNEITRNEITSNEITSNEITSNEIYNIKNLSNIILYGASGTGKYTSALNIIKDYSKSNLKYSKKILIQNTKIDTYIKISDIHFEIDMEILGCNAKILWNDIFYNILDIISSNDNCGIILCKNFHNINSELLDIFYSYMQKDIFSNHIIKFIILTESISFINQSILNISKIIHYERFNKTFYKRRFNVTNIDHTYDLNNLKSVSLNNFITTELTNLMIPYKKICDTIVNIILDDYKNIDLLELRKILYDILIYNLNIYDCIFYIIKSLINNKKIKNLENINSSLLENTYIFFKYYNNNYRPIYHLENYILYLIKLINEL